MKLEWVILSHRFSKEIIPKLPLIYSTKSYSLHATGKSIYKCNIPNSKYLIVDGFIMPRQSIFEKYKKCSPFQLAEILLQKYGDNFIDYIKGSFTIIIIENDRIKIFNDHLGINNFFYTNHGNSIHISNSIENLVKTVSTLEFDRISLAIKSLLHRNIAGYTRYKNILCSTPATKIEISATSILKATYWNSSDLFKNKKTTSTKTYADFAKLIATNIGNFIAYTRPQTNLITLTGGKDSRTGLAATHYNNIAVIGFTYGNPNSRDNIYAKLLANVAEIKHINVIPPNSLEWYENSALEIIHNWHPEINIHRAHRMYAFSEISKIFGEDSSCLTGYLGGELLMGIFYDNLIFTNFLTQFWSHTKLINIVSSLEKYFHLISTIDKEELLSRINLLRCVSPTLSSEEKELQGILEIGIPHYAQDLYLASKFLKYPYAFFLDIEFLEELFQSSFSFIGKNNKTSNLFLRYKLFEFNLHIQHILFPALDNVPFGKKGTYTTKEFLKGQLYWSLVRTIRYLTEKKNYPVTYSYGAEYLEFLSKWLGIIKEEKNNVLHDYFDLTKAQKGLACLPKILGESHLHPFSNIVTYHLQNLIYKNA